MYLFQIRRLVKRTDTKVIWTNWKTIDTFHRLPDLSEDLTFPSGLVEFRIQQASRTVWRSNGTMKHKYKHVSEVYDNTIILKTKAS